jgi:hypothetical protein
VATLIVHHCLEVALVRLLPILLLQASEFYSLSNPIHGKAALDVLHMRHTDDEGKLTVQHPTGKLG